MPRYHLAKATLLSAGLALALIGGPVVQAAQPKSAVVKSAASQKEEWLIPTGEHWSKATEVERRAYVLGILNLAMIEYQLTGSNPKYRTTVPHLVKALDGMTVPRIVETVDAYYTANPDKQQEPIIEVIWFQMVKPKADQSKAK